MAPICHYLDHWYTIVIILQTKLVKLTSAIWIQPLKCCFSLFHNFKLNILGLFWIFRPHLFALELQTCFAHTATGFSARKWKENWMEWMKGCPLMSNGFEPLTITPAITSPRSRLGCHTAFVLPMFQSPECAALFPSEVKSDCDLFYNLKPPSSHPFLLSCSEVGNLYCHEGGGRRKKRAHCEQIPEINHGGGFGARKHDSD